jgi:DNA mismatch endonuclease (patch repair protein)
MTDKLTPEKRSQNMSRIKSKDTVPEFIVRKLIHQLGHRFRLHRKDLPGKPDIVFPSKKKVIFVHGCFWHQHHDKTCLDSRMPKSNKIYWMNKLERNKTRDKIAKRNLTRLGWKYIVIWECETTKFDTLKNKLLKFLVSTH